MQIHMNLSFTATLTAAVLCTAACNLGSGSNPEPVTGDSGAAGGATTSDRNGTADSDGKMTETANNGLSNRLRLPNMTELPTDSELATVKPKVGGGGVIARPPSD